MIGTRTRRRRLGPGARAVVIGLAVVVGLEVLLVGLEAVFGGGSPGGPASSSFATAEDGLAGYAELLDRYGRPVRSLRGSLTEAGLDPGTTLVVLGGDPLEEDEAAEVGRFVRRGGRLVAGGASAVRWLSHGDVVDDLPVRDFEGMSEATPLVDDPAVAGVALVRAAGEGAWSDVGSARPVLGDRDEPPGTDVLLAVSRVGDGEVLLLADPSPLQNRLLGEADNALLGLRLAGEPGRTVGFAEGVHGYGAASGLAALPTGWRVALAGVALAAVLGMVAASRRSGPPEDEARPLLPARQAYVDALALSLARTRQPAASVAPLQAAARRELARRAGLGADADEAALRAAASSRGWPDDEVEALFTPAVDEGAVLAAGRALARVEGGDR
ncbi:MAG: DUF4350 domain-containing protein [Acidimicrobiia bacterium]|nr:DUF4350 domain-containing protein [Acidimicrobiia bacterium]